MSHYKHVKIYALITCFLCALITKAQDTSHGATKVFSFPDKLFTSIKAKAQTFENKFYAHTNKSLRKLHRQEEKLKKKVYKRDSLLAKRLFQDLVKQYDEIKLSSAALPGAGNAYSGHLDSLSSSIGFLKDLQIGKMENGKAIEATLGQLQKVQSAMNYFKLVEGFLQQRRNLLQQGMQQVQMLQELRQFKKQVYYYKTQAQEYRQVFEAPQKLEAILMEVLVKIPAFNDFFYRHSQLGQLFALPSPGGSGAASVSLAGLQTRSMLEQALNERFGQGQDVAQALQQNVHSGQSQFNGVRNSTRQLSSGSYGNGGDDDAQMPDFKPNSQKTKPFLKRLEYGTNFQSQRARNYFPVTTDVGLSLGYKINDRSAVGVGAAYKLGWGSGWNHIALSHQGVGLRSFVDWRLKGNLYVSGGYEQNYRSGLNAVDALRQYSPWQQSGLLGLTRKYKAGKVKGNMQLLWDFLSHKQTPRTQAVVWRVGYNIN